ncbi:MAG: hypothetical protein ACTHMC_15735 [Pseudobacter sp.]|uniref:hypothetical protein n=1 Tax=Pseudobacter sp. TaxID=2045420 RepID=UPI003F7F8C15
MLFTRSLTGWLLLVVFLSGCDLKKDCDVCSGTGKAICLPCNGQGNKPDGWCFGSGKQNCSDCSGMGRQNKSFYVGSKYKDGFQHVIWESYSGYTHVLAGYINVSITCKDCYGAGKEDCKTPGCRQGKVDCTSCNATGKRECIFCEGTGKS